MHTGGESHTVDSMDPYIRTNLTMFARKFMDLFLEKERRSFSLAHA